MFRLGELEIQRLSGPVSFHYLVPKKSTSPIIILLGDFHYSEEDRCVDCEEKDGCYLVESHAFLSQLNEIAKTYSVDVFTEFSKYKEEKDTIPGVLSRKFYQQTIACHQRNVDCLYPAIRWHYTDVRRWKAYAFESIVVFSLYYLEQLRKKLSIAQSLAPSQIERTLGVNLFQEFMFRLAQSCIKGETFDQLCQRWAKMMSVYILENPHSLVYKQLSKAKININIELYAYIALRRKKYTMNVTVGDWFQKVIDDPQLMANETLLTLYQHIFENQPLTIKSKLAAQSYQYVIENIYRLWTVLSSILLDIYFIGRSLKPSLNAQVVVGFFGVAHCEQLSHFFLDWYEVKTVSIQDHKRCVRFIQEVDLLHDLEKRALS